MSNAQLAYETIKKRILTGYYEPGQMLTEHQLAVELDMSRTPVRQALQRLTNERLLTSNLHKGVTVRQMSAKEIQDLFEFRFFLERHVMIQLFKQNKIKDAIKNLTEIHERLENEKDITPLTFMEMDHQFHINIVELTGNHLFYENMENIRNQILLIGTKVLLSQKHPYEEIYSEHHEILESLKKEDLELVIKQVRLHIENSHRRLLLL